MMHIRTGKIKIESDNEYPARAFENCLQPYCIFQTPPLSVYGLK